MSECMLQEKRSVVLFTAVPSAGLTHVRSLALDRVTK